MIPNERLPFTHAMKQYRVGNQLILKLGNFGMVIISNFEANSLSKCRSGKANELMCALNTFFALKLTGPEVVLNLSTLGFQSAN